MRIIVDRTLCTGHGICESIIDDLFTLNDDGELHVATDDVSTADESHVHEAIAQCPSGALSSDDAPRD